MAFIPEGFDKSFLLIPMSAPRRLMHKRRACCYYKPLTNTDSVAASEKFFIENPSNTGETSDRIQDLMLSSRTCYHWTKDTVRMNIIKVKVKLT